MALRELESAMVSETEAAVGNTTINHEAALAVVEMTVVVVVVAVDAVAAPEAGNCGSGCGSSGGNVDVGSGETADGQK